ncbi:MAG: T9SS type A sorting domain-containing protein [Bacteroidota bacterium]
MDDLTARFYGTGSARLGLYNQNGQLLRVICKQVPLELGKHEFKLVTNDLALGLYFVRLQTVNSIYSKKLLIPAQ